MAGGVLKHFYILLRNHFHSHSLFLLFLFLLSVLKGSMDQDGMGACIQIERVNLQVQIMEQAGVVVSTQHHPRHFYFS